MRGDPRLATIGLVLALAACGGDSDRSTPAAMGSFVGNQHIIYSDGLHSENTEMIKLGQRILLIFRGGEQGQTGSARARIKIFESTNNAQSFNLISEVNASDLPGERDIRDPKLVEMSGKLLLYAISRLPGFHYRDLLGQAWTIRAESTDGGQTWPAGQDVRRHQRRYRRNLLGLLAVYETPVPSRRPEPPDAVRHRVQ